MTERPTVVLDPDDIEENGLAVIIACQKAAFEAAWPEKTIRAFTDEAQALGYGRKDCGHLMDTVFEYFDVRVVSADRESVY